MHGLGLHEVECDMVAQYERLISESASGYPSCCPQLPLVCTVCIFRKHSFAGVDRPMATIEPVYTPQRLRSALSVIDRPKLTLGRPDGHYRRMLLPVRRVSGSRQRFHASSSRL